MKKYIPIILSGFIMGLTHQPIKYIWILAIVSLIPFIKFLDTSKYSFRNKIFMSFIWGSIYHTTVIFWMFFNLGMPNKWMSILSLIASVLILTINTILIVSLYLIIMRGKFERVYFFLPMIWVCVEYIKSFSIIGFPWASLANSQAKIQWIAQNVEYTGIYGISFWIVLVNVINYHYTYVKNNSKYGIVVVLITVIFPFLSGFYLYQRQQPSTTEPLSVVVVQPNISLQEKRSSRIFNPIGKVIKEIPKGVVSDSTDLVLLPETAFSYYTLRQNTSVVKDFINNGNTSLLSGILYRNEDRKVFNAVIHIDSNSIDTFNYKNIYNKIKLVPLAEYNPFQSVVGSNDIDIPLGNLTPGNEYKVFDINNHQVAAMVCYESTFPQLNREFIKRGAEVLAYFVNDGWYEDPYEPNQHANQSIFRAIEFRRPVIRCANTGISQIIDKKGNITQQLELNTSGIITANVIPSSEMTFYAKYGDIFSIINILLVFILLVMSFKKKE